MTGRLAPSSAPSALAPDLADAMHRPTERLGQLLHDRHVFYVPDAPTHRDDDGSLGEIDLAGGGLFDAQHLTLGRHGSKIQLQALDRRLAALLELVGGIGSRLEGDQDRPGAFRPHLREHLAAQDRTLKDDAVAGLEGDRFGHQGGSQRLGQAAQEIDRLVGVGKQDVRRLHSSDGAGERLGEAPRRVVRQARVIGHMDGSERTLGDLRRCLLHARAQQHGLGGATDLCGQSLTGAHGFPRHLVDLAFSLL